MKVMYSVQSEQHPISAISSVQFREMTTYKLNAYRQILEILYVCIYHNMLKVL